MNFRKKRDSFNEINITPLTDIFLVLLIIMMVIAPLLDQQGLNLSVPNIVDSNNKIENDPKVLTINVLNDNTLKVGEKTVDLDSIEGFIKQQSKNYPDGILIQTQPNAFHQTIVKIMDSARNAGVLNVSLSQI